jgi:glycosyltransferase involved in cell wall biosynthesis
MKRVSILLSVYNKEKYIIDTLKSIDSQVINGAFELELCIVDDCSTDSSMQLVHEYQWRNPIKLILAKTEVNSGLSTCLNIALDKSTGYYIVPHDADDLITRLGILKRFEALESNPDYDWVSGNELMMDINGKLIPGSEYIKTDSWNTAEELQDLVMGKMLIPAQSIMLRREVAIAERWDRRLFSTQDSWTNFTLTVKKYKLLKIDDYVAVYRAPSGENDNNSTHVQTLKTGRKYKDYLVIREAVHEYLTADQLKWLDGVIEHARLKSIAHINN